MVKLIPIYFSEQGISGSWFASWKISYGIGALLTGLVIARLLNRYSHENAMIISMFVMGGSLVVMGFYLSPIVIILLTVVIGFFSSYNRIARTNKMHHVIAMEERGRVDGGLKLFSTLSQSLSYVVIALLSYLQITELGFMIVGIVLLVAALTMINLKQSSCQQPLIRQGA
jgi:sugar phosphate permease